MAFMSFPEFQIFWSGGFGKVSCFVVLASCSANPSSKAIIRPKNHNPKQIKANQGVKHSVARERAVLLTDSLSNHHSHQKRGRRGVYLGLYMALYALERRFTRFPTQKLHMKKLHCHSLHSLHYIKIRRGKCQKHSKTIAFRSQKNSKKTAKKSLFFRF